MAGFFEALRAELKDAGVSVTIAYPGVVRTNIRCHGWNAEGEVAGISGLPQKAMTAAECAPTNRSRHGAPPPRGGHSDRPGQSGTLPQTRRPLAGRTPSPWPP
jgi:NAD(P)-dependent dehydrogenase (short-subunit alcohol dehydrogenase family)